MEGPRSLTDKLNALIVNLSIPLPFALETPSDLTPGLLLGILESLLQSRLPIAPDVRASRDFTNKVQAMKILLGVLETDVMRGEDVGLSDVDPRRLAAGEEVEAEFIGELLCWLGRRNGICAGLSRGDDPPPALPSRIRRRPASPSTHSTVTSGTHSNLSMMPTTFDASDTTVHSVASEPLVGLVVTELPDLPPLPLPLSTSRGSSSRPAPRCIHEIEDPSFAVDFGPDASTETSVCHCLTLDEEQEDDLPPTPKLPLPFRYSGQIDKADESSELRSYYHRRTPSTGPSSASHRSKSYSGLSASTSNSHSSPLGSARRIITPHNAPTEYTVALLAERARLLDELARIKGSSSTSG